MTIPLTDSGKGLFEILGKFVHALNTLNTARGTTVAAEVLDAVETYKLKTDATLDFDRAVASFPRSESQWRVSGDTLASAIARACRGLLIEFVLADDENVPRDLTSCLEYLIADIVTQDHHVSGNTLGASLSLPAGIRWSIGRTDQLSQPTENMLAEVIEFEVVTATVNSTTLRLQGERRARSKLAESFPAGSGLSTTLSALTPADSLLTNPGFEDGLEGWLQTGTSLAGDGLSSVHEFEVEVSGTPTTGNYWIVIDDTPRSRVVTAGPLAYNATSSQVEDALQAIAGFERVAVSTTGTSPNLTHTITMNGVAGNLSIDSTPNTFDTGGVAGSTTSAGNDNAISGVSLIWDENSTSSDDAAIQQAVTIPHNTPMVLAVHYKAGSGGATGLRISIVDSIGGNIVTNHKGDQISQTLAVPSGSSHNVLSMAFSLPTSVAMPCAVKIEQSGTWGDWMAIDNITLAPTTELYPGGPWVAALVGTDPPVVGATGTVTMTNNRASDWQQAFDQLFDMAGKRLVLPTSGSNLLNDNLIA